jgi:4-amino-4-deoxy-L-arabinose transferase-like glycosyltransferase
MSGILRAPQSSLAVPRAKPGRMESERTVRESLPYWRLPCWRRSALVGLLALTALAYLWGLGKTGWGYGIYAAAVQAGTRSWRAALFGSVDARNFISVDKSPGGLWVMEASARLFGLSSWSILVPEALEGVATVALVYLCVTRWSGARAGLAAALTTAIAPVSAAVFRFDNPDALLTLCLVGSAYTTMRAIDEGKARWSLLTGALLGAAFLAKLLEAVLVVPGLLTAYLLAGPGPVARRLRHIGWASGAALIAGGWWPALVEVTPAAARPFVGGTTNNNVMSLIFGYDGFGHLSAGRQSLASNSGLSKLWASATRLFGTYMGTQVSWMLLGAAILAAGTLVATGRTQRRDRTREAIILWGGWLVVAGGMLSFSRGTVHPYYTVILAPAIGALVGVCGDYLWRMRRRREVRWVLAGAVVATSVWALGVLDMRGPWRWLCYAVLLAGLASGAGLLVWTSFSMFLRFFVALVAVFGCVAGPVLYTVGDILNPSPGADPYAMAPGASPGTSEGLVGGSISELSRPGRRLIRELERGASRYDWVVATVGDLPAGGYQLATGDPAMAVGGWSGEDPAPSLSDFKELVGRREIHYFIPAGTFGGIMLGGSEVGSDACRVTGWVERNFSLQRVSGVIVYDLSSRPSRQPRPFLTGCVVGHR